MTVVVMPDGAKVRFPDDMPKEQIRDMIARKYPDAVKPASGPSPAYSGLVLPFSRDESGNVSFDENAGMIGLAKRAIGIGGSDLSQGNIKFDSDTGLPGIAKNLPGIAKNLPGMAWDAAKWAAGAPKRFITAEPFDPATGHASDEAIKAAIDVATLFNPVSPASRFGVARNIRGERIKAEPAVPSADDLLATGSRQFDEGRALNVKFEPAYINKLGREAEARMMQEGFDPTNAPKTFSVLKDMQQQAVAGAFASYDDILKIRSRLKKARMDFNNPADKNAAERLIGLVEGFVSQAPGTRAVRSGPAAALADIHGSALGNYAAAKRSMDLGNLERNALRRAAASNSGQNIGNTIRQRAASLLESPKKLKGFTAKEREALEQVANGTATQNTLRDISHLLGGGGGLGSMLTGSMAGYAASALGAGPLGALAVTGAAMSLGRGAKMATNKLTTRAMRNVDKMTRMRSPLYQQMIQSPQWKAANTEQRSAMLKSLFAMIQAEKAGANAR